MLEHQNHRPGEDRGEKPGGCDQKVAFEEVHGNRCLRTIRARGFGWQEAIITERFPDCIGIRLRVSDSMSSLTSPTKVNQLRRPDAFRRFLRTGRLSYS